MFSGSIVALVTPMHETGAIDEQSLAALLERHIEAKTDAIVVNGITGESPTLTPVEKEQVIKITLDIAKGHIPIIAGTGACSTTETIMLTEKAMKLGVDACLLVAPAYNKPTQEGLYQHYRAVAEAVSVPIILYNHPGRTVCEMLPETVERLSHFKNIVGLKEGVENLARVQDVLTLCGDRISLYSGDDASALAFMLEGGKGVISVTANIAPKEMRDMCAAALAQERKLAGEINVRLMPLHKNLFVETNPVPIKWALQQLGWIKGGIRLPLIPLLEKYHPMVKEAMKDSGVI